MPYSDDEVMRFKALFLTAYDGPGTFYLAVAAAGGPSRKTFERWEQDDPTFGEACREIDERVTDQVLADVRRDMQNPKTPALQRSYLQTLWLKAHKPEKFDRSARHPNDPEVRPPIINIYLSSKPDPDKRLSGSPRMIDAPAQEIISNEKE